MTKDISGKQGSSMATSPHLREGQLQAQHGSVSWERQHLLNTGS